MVSKILRVFRLFFYYFEYITSKSSQRIEKYLGRSYQSYCLISILISQVLFEINIYKGLDQLCLNGNNQ